MNQWQKVRRICRTIFVLEMLLFYFLIDLLLFFINSKACLWKHNRNAVKRPKASSVRLIINQVFLVTTKQKVFTFFKLHDSSVKPA